MKAKYILIVLIILSIGVQAQNKKTRLLVYDFHITNRCHTCASIEAATIETLNTYYKAELDSGIIVFGSYNCELPENADLVKKYSAYGSTLVLTAITADNKEIVKDITDLGFSKIGKKELYMQKLREEIDNMLKL